jgi:hypothetical protein
MAIYSSLIDSTALPISPSLASSAAITVMMFCNLNTTTEYVDIHVVAAADSPSDTNKVVNQLPIDPNDTFTFSTERLVLDSGDRIYASTTTPTQVSVTVSYVTI